MKRKLAECLKCGHIWLPRADTGAPRICPKCKSARWSIGPATPKTLAPVSAATNGSAKTASTRAKVKA
jgi:Zn finger protein HypA/HybF involved in hydrogenase expression